MGPPVYSASTMELSQGKNLGGPTFHSWSKGALSLRRVGNGAVHFWVVSEKKVFHTLRDRITEEALQSITLAQGIKSGLRERLGEEFLWDDKIQVHIDVGENGPTRDPLDQGVGMVKGFGFHAVIKP